MWNACSTGQSGNRRPWVPGGPLSQLAIHQFDSLHYTRNTGPEPLELLCFYPVADLNAAAG